MNVIKHTLRNEDMDVLKGIGMCLVLIAHSAGGFVHTFAYSFHMPLFFIASGYFYKPRGIMEGIKSDFKRLMIPFFFTEIVIFVGSILLIGVGNNNIVRPSEALEMLYYGNGGSDNYGKIWGNFASVGSVWFLPALFWAKTIYNAINHITPPSGIYKIILSTILCVFAVVIGQLIVFPFCMFQAMSSVIFIALGHAVHEYGIDNISNEVWKRFIISLCIVGWLVSSMFDVFDIYQMRWKLFVLPNIIFACTGTFVFFQISRMIVAKLHHMKKFLIWFSSYAIIILCFAPIKYYLLPIEDIFPFEGILHKLIILGFKVFWVYATVRLVLLIKPLRLIFKIK